MSSVAVTSTCRSRYAGDSTPSASTTMSLVPDRFGLTKFRGRRRRRTARGEVGQGRRAPGELGRRHGLSDRPGDRRAAHQPSRRRRRLPDVGRHRPLAAAAALRRPHGRSLRLVAGRRSAARAVRCAARGRRWRSTISPRRGDGVVLHLPAYPPFLELIRGTGRTLVDVPAAATADGFVWDYDDLDRRLEAGYDGRRRPLVDPLPSAESRPAGCSTGQSWR